MSKVLSFGSGNMTYFAAFFGLIGCVCYGTQTKDLVTTSLWGAVLLALVGLRRAIK